MNKETNISQDSAPLLTQQESSQEFFSKGPSRENSPFQGYQQVVVYVPAVEAAVTGSIVNYSASSLTRCLDENGVVSWEYLNSQGSDERTVIRNELETDKNLDILQKMALRVYFGTGRVKLIPELIYLTSFIIGIFVIINGTVWAVISFVSEISQLPLDKFSEYYFLDIIQIIASPFTLVGSIIVGVILIIACAYRSASPRLFMNCGTAALIVGTIVGFVCTSLVNVYGGIVMILMVGISGILMIVKGRQASRQISLSVKDESFDILCVAFLYKKYGRKWLGMPKYSHLSRYNRDKIRATVDLIYKRHPDLN